VAGGGDSALGEALVLATHADSVSIVFPEAFPHAHLYLQDAVRQLPNVELIPNARVVEITGDGTGVTGVQVRGAGQDQRGFATHGVFVYAGLVPDTGFLGGALKLDAEGRIEADAQMRTSVAGIYAAGDVRGGANWLLASAAQDGALAAASAASHIKQGDTP
jgi:thioredoxin reductase (NADPH)